MLALKVNGDNLGNITLSGIFCAKYHNFNKLPYCPIDALNCPALIRINKHRNRERIKLAKKKKKLKVSNFLNLYLKIQLTLESFDNEIFL